MTRFLPILLTRLLKTMLAFSPSTSDDIAFHVMRALVHIVAHSNQENDAKYLASFARQEHSFLLNYTQRKCFRNTGTSTTTLHHELIKNLGLLLALEKQKREEQEVNEEEEATSILISLDFFLDLAYMSQCFYLKQQKKTQHQKTPAVLVDASFYETLRCFFDVAYQLVLLLLFRSASSCRQLYKSLALYIKVKYILNNIERMGWVYKG